MWKCFRQAGIGFNFIFKENEIFVSDWSGKFSQISELIKWIRDQETVNYFIKIENELHTENQLTDVCDFTLMESKTDYQWWQITYYNWKFIYSVTMGLKKKNDSEHWKVAQVFC